MTNEKKQMSMDRRRMLAKLVLGSAAGLVGAACGGGSGGNSSEGSHDLRAALDRLQPGMTLAQVIAAVGWEPNDLGGIADWQDGDEWLHVTVNSLDGSGVLIITAAHWHRGSENIDRAYV